jgi:hypothetical protein
VSLSIITVSRPLAKMCLNRSAGALNQRINFSIGGSDSSQNTEGRLTAF